MKRLEDISVHRARPGLRGKSAHRVTVLGGGNGASTVLRGLAERVRLGDDLDITAVVATADDGGSSGRLRRERGGLPPGDIRSCLLALASNDRSPLSRLFGHRYSGNGNLAGHSLGNLILEALVEKEGDILGAIRAAEKYLQTNGRVLPVSMDNLRLEGEDRDGSRYSGESNIGNSYSAIRRVWLEPRHATPVIGVIDAVRGADLLVLGPGSLYTSLLAVLMVPGVSEAFRECGGRKVLISNIMTQPGETWGMNLEDHMEALDSHVGSGLVDSVLAHHGPIDPDRLCAYRSQRSEPVTPDLGEIRTERLVKADLVTTSGKVRHDSQRLAVELLRFIPGALRAVVQERHQGVGHQI